jgi:hypothetical protein
MAIDSAFRVEALSLDDQTYIVYGIDDPSVTGFEAPVGTLYIRLTGSTYQKTGVTNLDWTLFEAGASGSHNALSGLQGGTVGEYFHFTSQQHTDVLAHYPDTNNPHSTSLFNLSDTLIAGAINGQLLRYVGGSPPTWENYTETHFTDTTNPHNTTLDNLFDTTITSPADGQLLRYSAGSPAGWENYTETHFTDTTNPHFTSVSNLSDVQFIGSPAPLDSQTIVYNGLTGFWENRTIAVPPAGGGRLIQVNFLTIPGQSGTTSIPISVIPSVTDGTQIISTTITPTEATSIIRIHISMLAGGSNSNTEVAATVFRDSVFVGSNIYTVANKDSGGPLVLTLYDDPATTAPITYQVRVGRAVGNGAWYINTLPGSAATIFETNSFTVEEIGQS